jgi:hypothetical protein
MSGIINQHQEQAIKLMSLPEKDAAKNNFRAFYERMAEPEP